MKSLYNISILILLLAACITKQPLVYQPSLNHTVSNNLDTDNKVADIIKPYTIGMAESMNEVIGYSHSFEEKHKPSSALGNFMCDAVFEITYNDFKNANFCLLNYGGIRSTLDSGEITVGEMYQLMPFENEIVVLKLEQKYLDSLRVIVDSKGGEPMSESQTHLLDKDEFFYLVTNDYMANGGDNYSILMNAIERIETGIKIRDALISYVTQHDTITFDYSNRNL
ncbi:MAG: hypothetical protein COA58_06300 [Bacteroidetes bacterium]|nr:MAG: hypothetical protein COA58_06300 [Bacteroidota bacterium]